MTGKSRNARVSRNLFEEMKRISEMNKMSQIEVGDMIAKDLKRGKVLRKIKGRKAQTDNLGFILVAFFIMALAVIPTYWIISTFNDEAQINDAFTGKGAEILASQNSKFPALFDGLTITVLVILYLALLGSAFIVDSQPFFFVISIIIFIFILLLAALFANIWDDMTTANAFSSLANDLPITNFVFQNLLVVFGVMGFSSLVVLYAKLRGAA